MGNDSMVDNKCVLPFINHDYQSNSPCCILQKYKDKTDRDELIADHTANKKSRFCEGCWKTEDVGIESKRQRYNRIYKQYLKQTHNDVKLNIIPVGNVCGLSCITCGPNSSTGWFKKYNFINNTTSKYTVEQNIKTENLKDIKNLEHIEFIGGETLQSQSLWDYLKVMDKNVSFSLQTNGTIILTQEQINLLKTFQTFNICFSIDGYNKIFEYLRQPANWQATVTNIRRYADFFGRNKLSYYITVSNLNIFYIDTIAIELFKVLPIPQMLNFAHWPAEFSYNNLTSNLGKIVEKRNPGFFKKRKINWTGTKTSLQKTISNLTKQDEFSGMRFSDSLPEVYQLINDFVKK